MFSFLFKHFVSEEGEIGRKGNKSVLVYIFLFAGPKS